MCPENAAHTRDIKNNKSQRPIFSFSRQLPLVVSFVEQLTILNVWLRGLCFEAVERVFCSDSALFVNLFWMLSLPLYYL